jgi:endonuclease YncB( thermonuclease family)
MTRATLLAAVLAVTEIPVSVVAAPAIVARCVDGDTCTLTSGEKVRLLVIDAPELRGARCGRERVMAIKARDRLSELVAGRRVELERSPKRDAFRRTLATIAIDGRDVGEIMLAEGLAVHWRAGLRHERPGPWCSQ